MNKRIITAAITGSIHTPTMSPYLPITPQQIADETVRAYEAGATVAHIHVRNPKTGAGSADLEIFREVATKIKSRCNIILCLTTGGTLGDPIETRGRVVTALKPEIASINFGSLNFGIFHIPERMKIKEFKFPWELEYLNMTEDFVLRHTFKDLRILGQIFSQENTKPEIEIYDAGMINNLAYMIEKGYFKKPVYLQFVMGILGGIPVSINNLLFLYNTAREIIGDFVWSVCAAGRGQMPMCTIALAMDGNVRVGLEDNLNISRGVLAKSNAEQVEKIVRIARELGLEPVTPDEGRQILGLKGLDKVAY